MKKTIVLSILCIFSLNLIAQCSDCHSFEEAFKAPEKVKTLKINPYQHDKLTLDSVPTQIGTLVNIEYLFMVDHNIQEIPSEIGQLTRLKELSFAGCQLTAVPEELYQLKNLKEVILWYNSFTEETKAAIKKRFKEELPWVKLRLD